MASMSSSSALLSHSCMHTHTHTHTHTLSVEVSRQHLVCLHTYAHREQRHELPALLRTHTHARGRLAARPGRACTRGLGCSVHCNQRIRSQGHPESAPASEDCNPTVCSRPPITQRPPARPPTHTNTHGREHRDDTFATKSSACLCT